MTNQAPQAHAATVTLTPDQQATQEAAVAATVAETVAQMTSALAAFRADVGALGKAHGTVWISLRAARNLGVSVEALKEAAKAEGINPNKGTLSAYMGQYTTIREAGYDVPEAQGEAAKLAEAVRNLRKAGQPLPESAGEAVANAHALKTAAQVDKLQEKIDALMNPQDPDAESVTVRFAEGFDWREVASADGVISWDSILAGAKLEEARRRAEAAAAKAAKKRAA